MREKDCGRDRPVPECGSLPDGERQAVRAASRHVSQTPATMIFRKNNLQQQNATINVTECKLNVMIADKQTNYAMQTAPTAVRKHIRKNRGPLVSPSRSGIAAPYRALLAAVTAAVILHLSLYPNNCTLFTALQR